DKNAAWYLIAGTANGLRTFRVDRIVASHPTGERFDRPAEFDLEAAWDEAVEEVERQRARATATVRVPISLTGVFAGQWGRHATVTERGPEATVVVVAGASHVAIARQLAGWADAIDIVEPAAVREELVRIAAA